MRIHVAVLGVAVALVFGGQGLAQHETRTPIGELALIREAAREPDQSLREAKLRTATVHLLLESGDGALHKEALAELRELAPWLDLRFLGDVLERFAVVDISPARARSLEDDIERRFVPRDTRASIYRTAMEEGKSTLRHGTVLLRGAAALDAAGEGLSELRRLIESSAAETLAPFRSRVVPLLELTGGATDEVDAGVRAGARLRGMGARFAFRMAGDEGFREAVLDLAGIACRRSPIDGSSRDCCRGFEALAKENMEMGGVGRDRSAGRSQSSSEVWRSQLLAVVRE